MTQHRSPCQHCPKENSDISLPSPINNMDGKRTEQSQKTSETQESSDNFYSNVVLDLQLKFIILSTLLQIQVDYGEWWAKGGKASLNGLLPHNICQWYLYLFYICILMAYVYLYLAIKPVLIILHLFLLKQYNIVYLLSHVQQTFSTIILYLIHLKTL